MSRRHEIDIVAGAQKNHMSEVVRGSIVINIGDPKKERAIDAMYGETDKAVYALLTGQAPPLENPLPHGFVPSRDDYIRQEQYIAKLEAQIKAMPIARPSDAPKDFGDQ